VPPVDRLASVQIPGGIFFKLVEVPLVHLLEQAFFDIAAVLAVKKPVFIRYIYLQGFPRSFTRPPEARSRVWR
jgi:hypothetical protein